MVWGIYLLNVEKNWAGGSGQMGGGVKYGKIGSRALKVTGE